MYKAWIAGKVAEVWHLRTVHSSNSMYFGPKLVTHPTEKRKSMHLHVSKVLGAQNWNRIPAFSTCSK